MYDKSKLKLIMMKISNRVCGILHYLLLIGISRMSITQFNLVNNIKNGFLASEHTIVFASDDRIFISRINY